SLQQSRSLANQSMLSFVNQYVGDSGCARWFDFTADSVILGRQLFQLFSARWRTEQRLQFLLTFMKGFLGSHWSSLAHRWAIVATRTSCLGVWENIPKAFVHRNAPFRTCSLPLRMALCLRSLARRRASHGFS